MLPTGVPRGVTHGVYSRDVTHGVSRGVTHGVSRGVTHGLGGGTAVYPRVGRKDGSIPTVVCQQCYPRWYVSGVTHGGEEGRQYRDGRREGR